jgi:hypothetical protein
MTKSTLEKPVMDALRALMDLAAKDAEPIRQKIAKIKDDVEQMNEGDFAVPALTQAIAQLENAVAETLVQSKAVLAQEIIRACKTHGIPLNVPARTSSPPNRSLRLAAVAKAKAKAAMMSHLAGEAMKDAGRSQLADAAGITPDQAAGIIAELVKEGSIAKHGTGRNTTYQAK